MGCEGGGGWVMQSHSQRGSCRRAAGEFFADMLDDFLGDWVAFERLGNVLAELAQSLAAAFFAGTGGRFDDALDGQVFGQLSRPARGAGAFVPGRIRRGDIGPGFNGGLCLPRQFT